jgi:hypothetical protein
MTTEKVVEIEGESERKDMRRKTERQKDRKTEKTERQKDRETESKRGRQAIE